MTDHDWIFAAIKAERTRQDRKWGPVTTRQHGLDRWMTILGEEYGEACRCVLEANPLEEQLPGDWILKLRKELIQVAAVSVAMLEILDPFDSHGALKEGKP